MGWKMIEQIRDEYRDGSDMGLREISTDPSYRMGLEDGYRRGYADAMREVARGESYRERMPRDSYRRDGGYPMSGFRGEPYDNEGDYEYDMGERRRRDSRGRYM